MLLDKQDAYVIEYPQAVEFAEAQEHIAWTATEIAMDKDLHDLHNSVTEAEKHGVVTVLKLFTKYETHVGNEYWLDFVRKVFQRPEIQRMATEFGRTELSIHAPFYNRINEVLNLDTEDFYNSYVEDDTLNNRMKWLERQFSKDKLLESLAIGSITEGAILYSNFAFLKHFQAEGKNKLVNLSAGINFSVRDENLHSLAGAWLYRTLLKESNLKAEDKEALEEAIQVSCDQVYEHEGRIIDMIFEKGDIKGITEHQMKQFIKSRLNLCLKQLGMEERYAAIQPAWTARAKAC
jgi:ribonucleotide reductase beta subunit family protein with ferritin-like domain